MSWTLDLSQPVDLSHPLNVGRDLWCYTEIGSGAQLRNLMPGDRFHGTLTGFSGTDRPWASTGRGDFGNNLNGTSSDVNFGTADFLDIGSTSLSAAISVRVAVGYGWNAGILAKAFAAGGVGRWAITANATGPLALVQAVPVEAAETPSVSGLADGRWHRLLMVIDRLRPRLELYVDGNLRGSVFFFQSAGYVSTSYPLRMGSYGNSSATAPSLFLTGQLSDPAKWSKALTATEVSLDYEQSLRGYRTPDSPLRWIRGITYGFLETANYTLAADTGTLTATGQDASLFANRSLTADPASYSLTGQDASLLASRRVAADAPAFTLAGQSAGLLANRVLTGGSANYAATGQDASFATSRRISADASAFTIVGQTASLRTSRRIAGDVVAFVVVGQNAGLSVTTNTTVFTPGLVLGLGLG